MKLQYAVNTESDVFKDNDTYYLCDNAVWFKATTPNGPWQVADERPEDIEKIPSIMLSDGSQFGFSKKGLELLEHVQEEIDRAHMIITRTDYQDKIRTLQHPIAQQRIKKLEKHINKIMKVMLDTYKDVRSNVIIQEYFQNHTDELKFRK